MFNQKRRN
uniref:Uncharacterized protein n=1 Tax=Anguilla anguilla TaxID=7936 RepID=A0A0E9T193_ANGAN